MKVLVLVPETDYRKTMDFIKSNISTENEIVLLHAYPYVNDTIATPLSLSIYRKEIDTIQEERKQKATALISPLVIELRDMGYKVQGFVSSGVSKVVIDVEVKKIQPDLIVMGKRGLGVVAQAVLGSISNHMLHTHNVPTVVVA
ncbi:hypothetical protein HDV06_000592 [Boothiomyces sp. JEL0866]|nr:hypothetical protein HDV06_000592 [Boothiomyces sp. JEL0866]